MATIAAVSWRGNFQIPNKNSVIDATGHIIDASASLIWLIENLIRRIDVNCWFPNVPEED